MLIDNLAPRPDTAETHTIKTAASREVVYRSLWTVDLGGSPIIKSLLALRSLPERIVHPKRQRHPSQKVTLSTLVDAGFGKLAEEPGRELVLGVTGRFWRPVDDILPFRSFD